MMTRDTVDDEKIGIFFKNYEALKRHKSEVLRGLLRILVWEKGNGALPHPT